MSKVIAIAFNTWREAIRNRILYIFVFFALAMMILSGVASTLAIGEHEKIMRDLGLGGISFFGLLIALFVGIGLVYNDIERKTLYTIVSKPIDRKHFILGKYFGLLGTIYTVTFLMTLFFFCTLHFRHYTSNDEVSKAIGAAPTTRQQLEYLGNSFIWSARDACVSFTRPFVKVELPEAEVAAKPAADDGDGDGDAAKASEAKQEATAAAEAPRRQASYVVPLITLRATGDAKDEKGLGAHYVSGVFERTQGLLVAIFLTWIEFAIIVAFAVLFSCFSTPFLSFFFTTVVFVIGRLNLDIMRFVDFLTRKTPYDKMDIGERVSFYFAHGAALVSPNLTYFNQRYRMIYEGAVPYLDEVGRALVYGVGYSAIVLLLSIFIFNRRNFK